MLGEVRMVNTCTVGLKSDENHIISTKFHLNEYKSEFQ